MDKLLTCASRFRCSRKMQNVQSRWQQVCGFIGVAARGEKHKTLVLMTAKDFELVSSTDLIDILQFFWHFPEFLQTPVQSLPITPRPNHKWSLPLCHDLLSHFWQHSSSENICRYKLQTLVAAPGPLFLMSLLLNSPPPVGPRNHPLHWSQHVITYLHLSCSSCYLCSCCFFSFFCYLPFEGFFFTDPLSLDHLHVL